jgi:hypothetical protein
MSAYLYGGLGGVILALAGLLWWKGHQLDHANTAIAALLADRAAQAQAVADQVAQNERLLKATENLNAKIMVDLQGKLDASVTDGERLAARLRLALTRPDHSPLPSAQDQPATAPASGAEVAARTAQLVGDVTAECERNADRLDAWIAEIKPQL